MVLLRQALGTWIPGFDCFKDPGGIQIEKLPSSLGSDLPGRLLFKPKRRNLLTEEALYRSLRTSRKETFEEISRAFFLDTFKIDPLALFMRENQKVASRYLRGLRTLLDDIRDKHKYSSIPEELFINEVPVEIQFGELKESQNVEKRISQSRPTCLFIHINPKTIFGQEPTLWLVNQST